MDYILTESSLSRILQKVNEYDCVMISAFRSDFKTSENKQRSSKLLQQILSLDYSATKIRGGYVEKTESGDKEVLEDSYFVVNHNNDEKFLHNLKKLGIKYEQDSILIIPKGGKNAYLYGTNDAEYPGKHKKDIIGSLSLGKITQMYFSKIGGRAFEFKHLKESINYDHITPSSAKGFWCKSRIKNDILSEMENIELKDID